ncbi:MAG: hypothetical protein CL916_06890 [Deltaproteobacteria bacterium]|nr:hypothetical protein [Deltaproteobacteria bacterium]
MIPVYTSKDVRRWDQLLIEQDFPSHTLMELAGKGTAEYLHQHHPAASFAIFCGSGNNGGDGYVIARWLLLWGHDVSIVCVSSPKTQDAICNAKWCSAPKKSLYEISNEHVVIDAMLGTGQNREPIGRYQTSIEHIIKLHEKGSTVYALDVPTGVNPDTGAPFGDIVVPVDGCFSFGKPKTALYRNASMGSIIHIDIGFDLITPPITPDAYLIEQEDILRWWPTEKPSFAKWNRGHVAVVARGGAAVLAAHAALIMGAGLVSIVCSQEDWNSMKGLRPEIMHTTSISRSRHDCIVFGPGITEYEQFSELWQNYPKPMVLDAGGISLLAKQKEQSSSYDRVLTPHSAEAGRLLNIPREDVEKNPFAAVKELQKFGFSILKGPYTKIGEKPLWIAPKGSIQLATAGSGDILAGMIGALLAKGLPKRESSAIACSIHAFAGMSMKKGDTASDLIQKIKVYLT